MVLGSRLPIGEGIGRFSRNIGFDQRLRRKYGRHQKLTLHPRQLVTGNATEVDEVSRFCHTKDDRRACAPTVHPRRFRVLVGKYDVMFGALAVDQGELHDLAFGRGMLRLCSINMSTLPGGWPCAANRATNGTITISAGHQPPRSQIDLALRIRNVLFNIDHIRTFVFYRIDTEIRCADRCSASANSKGRYARGASSRAAIF